MADSRELSHRVVELIGRMNVRLDEMSARHDQGLARVERRIHEMASDMVLMEDRIVTAIHEVRNIAARMDEEAAERGFATAPVPHG